MKNPSAVALGSLGGKARAKLSKEKLREIAMTGVEARRLRVTQHDSVKDKSKV